MTPHSQARRPTHMYCLPPPPAEVLKVTQQFRRPFDGGLGSSSSDHKTAAAQERGFNHQQQQPLWDDKG